MKHIITLFIALIITPVPAFALSPSAPVSGTATVINVVDGDTYDLQLDSQQKFNAIYQSVGANEHQYMQPESSSIRVRLGSIDTAESKHPDASKNTAEGRRASAIVASKLQGARVGYKCYDLGYYKRVICHISQNNQDLGAWLIQLDLSDYIDQYGRDPYLHELYTRLDREK
ncbi:hypothetical protein EZI54_07395 [Marinobacter halodurans]|uniref:TNase-like domain-containing protein n=1 Tax=Marinobacter halodurans TaxID=2528979 RepID=A0ABY1ZR70_9GAMM|nr:thermonuclease family protein [Marinobacter halodurans]TBW57476.1 hypothetical protein EZI54_07395 [Marinobacter halodurans]